MGPEAICEARERLGRGQRDADLERGRSAGDDRRPRGPDGKPTGGRYQREPGVPQGKAQENFPPPARHIVKRASGGFDPSHNAQAAVDESAQVIVVAELDNTAPDANRLLPMIQAVQAYLGKLPELGLADAGYRGEDDLRGARSKASWRSGAKARSTRRSTLVSTRTSRRWPPSCRQSKDGRLAECASGSPSCPTAGSGTCWGSVGSACGGCTGCAPSGSSFAWR
jgi:hypothetical protein